MRHQAHTAILWIVSTARSPSSTFANLALEDPHAVLERGRIHFDGVKPGKRTALHRRDVCSGFQGAFDQGYTQQHFAYGSSSPTLLLLHSCISLMAAPLPPSSCCFLSPFPLSASVLVARGQFVTENTSFSHLVAAIL